MSAIRHTRQARLAEVGEAGQARLATCEIAVRGEGAAGEIEAAYLAGAGVGALRVTDDASARAARAIDPSVRVVDADRARAADAPSPIDALRFDGAPLDPSAREVAIGAWRALDSLRRALAGESVRS